jgi:DNA-binding response OmpR family regulator
LSESNPKILILDDDLLALELYTRELKEQYAIRTAVSVEEARSLLAREMFDIMIVEPAVNDGEGWAFSSEIITSSNPPVTVLCSVEDDRKVGLEQGADAFIVKPVLMSALHTLLDQLAAKRIGHTIQKAEKGK